MPVALNGATSGSVTITAPAVAGTNTLTLPAVTDTLVGEAATQTLTNKSLVLAAGTASAAPLGFAAGTNLTTALAGALEYDGKVFYGTPQGTQRGIIPDAQFFRLESNLVGLNTTAVQSTFGVSVTLSTSTVYAFEALYYLNKTAGATSHTVGVNFGGSATLNSILYSYNGFDINAAIGSRITSTQVDILLSNIATNTIVTGSIANTAANVVGLIKGIVSINGGGTFTPRYALSAAPGGAYSTMANSYFLIYPIGASGSNTSVGAWA